MEESGCFQAVSLGHWMDGLTENGDRKHTRGEDVKFNIGLLEVWMPAGCLLKMSIKQLKVHMGSLSKRWGLMVKELALYMWKLKCREECAQKEQWAEDRTCRGETEVCSEKSWGPQNSSLMIRWCSLNNSGSREGEWGYVIPRRAISIDLYRRNLQK